MSAARLLVLVVGKRQSVGDSWLWMTEEVG